jgi:energy-coupling factor transporter ATP-binding protein EcfA2
MHLVRDLFDRTVILDDGCIVADAPTTEILSDVELLFRYGLEAP